MNDYKKIANALIAALTSSASAQKKANNTALLNTNATINNQANSSGTLYSTAPSFRQEQATAANIQANAKLDSDLMVNKLNTQSSILDTQYKIQAMQRAAKSLDKVKFYI